MIENRIHIRLSGEHLVRFVNICIYHEISFYQLRSVSKQCWEGIVLQSDFEQIHSLKGKTGTDIRITKKEGWSEIITFLKHHIPLVTGVVSGYFLLFLLSFFVWQIDVSGNRYVTENQIIEYLHTCDVYEGQRKNVVDCKRLSEELRKQFDTITWVSIQKTGTRLMIEIQDRDPVPQEASSLYEKDLYADCAGIVTAIHTRAGTPQVKVGSEVKKGDLLVGGFVEITDDSNEVIKTEPVDADADVWIQYTWVYESSWPLEHTKKVYTGKEKKTYAIRMKDQSISLGNASPGFEQYDRMIKETRFHYTKHEVLPFRLIESVCRETTYLTKTYTQKQAKEKANAEIFEIIENLHQKGVQIFENDVKIALTDFMCQTRCSFVLCQQVSTRQSIQTE